jgi:hypothetical protein
LCGIACCGAETNRYNNNGHDRTPLNNRFSEIDSAAAAAADNNNNNNKYKVKSNNTANGLFRSVLHSLYHGVLHAVSQYGSNVTSFTPIKVHPSLRRFSANSKNNPKVLCANLLYRISPHYCHQFGKYWQEFIYVLE